MLLLFRAQAPGPNGYRHVLPVFLNITFSHSTLQKLRLQCGPKFNPRLPVNRFFRDMCFEPFHRFAQRYNGDGRLNFPIQTPARFGY